MSENRLSNLDVMRAVAALAVCAFHFDRDGFLGISAVSEILRYGHLGVDVFFVISGFIIPYALLRSGYRIRDMRGFLASRLIRLYPAYFAAGVLAVALWYLSALVPGFRGDSPSFSLAQIFSNVFLLCDFTGESWFIPVFWTLAVEAQYYLLIAFSFPLFLSRSRAFRWGTLSVWVSAPIVAGVGPSVFTWTALFALGIISFLWKEKKITSTELLLGLAAASIVHGLTNGVMSAAVGVVSAFAIGFLPRIRLTPMIWIGMVSYSLYLIHVPIGGRVINLAERLPEITWIRAAAIMVAGAVSIGFAAVFYHLVEKPSHRLSRKVRKRVDGETYKGVKATATGTTSDF